MRRRRGAVPSSRSWRLLYSEAASATTVDRHRHQLKIERSDCDKCIVSKESAGFRCYILRCACHLLFLHPWRLFRVLVCSDTASCRRSLLYIHPTTLDSRKEKQCSSMHLRHPMFETVLACSIASIDGGTCKSFLMKRRRPTTQTRYFSLFWMDF